LKVRFVEVTNGPRNWGKFLLCRFEPAELAHASAIIPGRPLLHSIGWDPRQVWVMDLQTCEGAAFLPGGLASADLEKHRVWVCPMFEPFLTWLYKQDLSDLDALPAHVDLANAPFAMHGYRRRGPG
jgi:hypothetical protein